MRATSDDKSHLSPSAPLRARRWLRLRRSWQATMRLAWWPRGRDQWHHPAWPVSPVLHPACLLATIALALNDWVLKPSQLAGTFTGKLSDVAGLVVAPLWMAALIGTVAAIPLCSAARVFSRRRLAICIVCVGGVFIACKTSVTAANAVAAILAIATHAMGWAAPRIVADPTDLLALPALWFAWRVGVDDQRRVPLGTVRAAQRWMRRCNRDHDHDLAHAIAADDMVKSGASRADVDQLVAALGEAHASAAAAARVDAALEKLAGL